MTIWLERMTVQEYIVSRTGATADISFTKTDDERVVVEVTFHQSFSMSETDLDEWSRFLSCIRDGNPEMSFSAEGDSIVVEIEADESVYRDN